MAVGGGVGRGAGGEHEAVEEEGGGLAGDGGHVPVPRHPVRDERVPLGLAHDVAGQPPARRLDEEDRPLREYAGEVEVVRLGQVVQLMLLKRNMSSVVNRRMVVIATRSPTSTGSGVGGAVLGGGGAAVVRGNLAGGGRGGSLVVSGLNGLSRAKMSATSARNQDAIQ